MYAHVYVRYTCMHLHSHFGCAYYVILLSICLMHMCTIFHSAVKSFIELGKYVLSLPGVPPFLSRRITQDPLEKYFGLQRQRGRVNENPNVQEFQKNSQALRVVQACLQSVKGNCRGNVEVDRVECEHLRRRNSHTKH